MSFWTYSCNFDVHIFDILLIKTFAQLVVCVLKERAHRELQHDKGVCVKGLKQLRNCSIKQGWISSFVTKSLWSFTLLSFNRQSKLNQQILSGLVLACIWGQMKEVADCAATIRYLSYGGCCTYGSYLILNAEKTERYCLLDDPWPKFRITTTSADLQIILSE